MGELLHLPALQLDVALEGGEGGQGVVALRDPHHGPVESDKGYNEGSSTEVYVTVRADSGNLKMGGETILVRVLSSKKCINLSNSSKRHLHLVTCQAFSFGFSEPHKSF